MICPYCSSVKIRKSGVRTTSSGDQQRFTCVKCGKWYQSPITQNEFIKDGIIEPGGVLTFKFDDTIRVHGATDVHLSIIGIILMNSLKKLTQIQMPDGS